MGHDLWWEEFVEHVSFKSGMEERGSDGSRSLDQTPESDGVGYILHILLHSRLGTHVHGAPRSPSVLVVPPLYRPK